MIRDALGREFDFHHPPRRVVSLVPSLTETLFALGAGDAVAGITDFCIFPPDLDRPRLGGTKNPSVAGIRELAPDLVYVNLEENLRRHADEIASFAPLFATEPKSVDDVITLLELLGRIHHRQEPAAAIVHDIRQARAAARGKREFTFLVPIWKKPWMWCGGDTYVSNLVESAGGRNMLGHQNRYPTMDLECALALQPEIIFLPDEPYRFTAEDAADVGRALARPDGLKSVPHFPRVIGPFPGHLFTWHGVRTREGIRFLRTVL
jgi:ABC-type Fe3+-hydroxamate transport system substrate-binding protein